MTTPLTESSETGTPTPGDDSFFAGLQDYSEVVEPDSRPFNRHLVTAVLVAHNGARWLPKTLTALRRLTRQPQLVVAVDTGSTDATVHLLATALGSSAVVSMPRDTGFGAAVHHVVDAGRNAPGRPSDPDGPPVEWLWLLHDDSAPDPEALRRLLAAVDQSPSIAIAGPKVCGWSDPTQLLEMGVTIGGGGRRETGMERRCVIKKATSAPSTPQIAPEAPTPIRRGDAATLAIAPPNPAATYRTANAQLP